MGLFKKRNKKRRGVFGGRLKKAVKKVGSGIKKAAKKTGRFIKKTVAEGGLLPLLLPFKKLMSTAVKRKGYKPETKLINLAKQFYDVVVRQNAFDEAHYFDGDKPFQIDVYQDDFPNYGNKKGDSVAPAAIGAIVTAVVNFIKNLKDRKKEGQPLTKNQEVIVDLAEKADEEVEQIKDKEVENEIGSFVTNYWWAIAAIILLVVIKSKK